LCSCDVDLFSDLFSLARQLLVVATRAQHDLAHPDLSKRMRHLALIFTR